MQIQPTQMTLEVPSTSANLGPGFDCIGLALNLGNQWTLKVEPAPSSPGVCEVTSCSGEGCDYLPSDASHLFFANWDTLYLMGFGPNLFTLLKDSKLAARLESNNGTPLARGLGSSAAVLVASSEAYRQLTGSMEFTAWQMASAVERHPDNAAPAGIGGLVSGMRAEDGVYRALSHPIHSCWQVVAVIPSFTILTEDARRVLPPRYDQSQCIYNMSRIPFLLEGLARGDSELLGLGCDDWLHQRQRASLIPGFRAVLAAGREAGAAAGYLSGAGPTLAAFVDQRKGEDLAQRVAERMRSVFSEHGVEARALTLDVDHTGLKVLTKQLA